VTWWSSEPLVPRIAMVNVRSRGQRSAVRGGTGLGLARAGGGTTVRVRLEGLVPAAPRAVASAVAGSGT
jgi:hypothetical protein